ncbi:OLC1v1035031C1 [Oldenlandia corymbosa var. corymbosa]|uniref:OLC1v1035031C1 n=1 Tax=Oldenlandia corymbosa var. corymbosa TaxID=529605 RepID=A0AAV1CUM8_OLDCO|nr:OLC1v1035031C1 [Oldenlandia corymbosa var. corymbosa]
MVGVRQDTVEKRYDKDYLCKFDPKSIFGKYSYAQKVAQLKELALDPCNSKFSNAKIQPLWNQTLWMRKAMSTVSIDTTQRKRKLQQLLKEIPGSSSRISHASFASCLLNSIGSATNFGKTLDFDLSSSNNAVTFEENIPDKLVYSRHLSRNHKDVIYLVDGEESLYRSNNERLGKTTSKQDVPSINVLGISHPYDSQVDDSSKKKHLQLRRQSNRLSRFLGDDPQRKVIPIGDRFQADIPECTGPKNGCDDQSSKWLGTQIWPMEGRKGNSARTIGQGKTESCSCFSRGSVDCVQVTLLRKDYSYYVTLVLLFFV